MRLYRVLLSVVKNKPCPNCGCERKQHSFNGCVNHPWCTRKYMDWDF